MRKDLRDIFKYRADKAIAKLETQGESSNANDLMYVLEQVDKLNLVAMESAFTDAAIAFHRAAHQLQDNMTRAIQDMFDIIDQPAIQKYQSVTPDARALIALGFPNLILNYQNSRGQDKLNAALEIVALAKEMEVKT